MKVKLKSLDQLSFKSIQVIFIKGLGIIFTYLLMLFITNFFSEDLVGKYSLVNNILIISGTICLFGANLSIYQLGANFHNNGDKLGLKRLYLKYASLSLAIYLLVLIIVFIIPEYIYEDVFNEKDIYILILKTVSFAYVYFLSIINFEMLRVLHKIKTSEIFRSIFRTMSFFIGVLVVYYIQEQHYLTEVFLLSYFLTAVITTGVVYRILRKKSEILESNSSISYKKIIKVSLPMSMGALFLLLMQSFDSFFIIKYKSFTEVAYYSTAIKITLLISIILTSINTIIAPEIAKFYYKRDLKKVREIIYNSSKLNFLLTIPLLLCLLFFPHTILSFFGENYTNAKNALIILSIGQIINSFCGSVGLYLNMTGKQKESFLLLFIALIINIVLNFILVPRYGIEGAAIANSTSLVFWNITGLIFIYYKDKVITFFRI